MHTQKNHRNNLIVFQTKHIVIYLLSNKVTLSKTEQAIKNIQEYCKRGKTFQIMETNIWKGYEDWDGLGEKLLKVRAHLVTC